jgi:hypothetical protein
MAAIAGQRLSFPASMRVERELVNETILWCELPEHRSVTLLGGSGLGGSGVAGALGEHAIWTVCY